MKALEMRQVTKTYPSGFVALQAFDLLIEQGDFFALLGPNGAGKSTTIGILSSLITKTSGEIKIFGHDLDTERSLAKTFIGLVPQEFNFNQFECAFDILVNQAGYYGIPRRRAIERAQHYLKALGLWDKRQVPSRMLSGGMKRRLMIARALIHEPKMLILDEPTAGVDIELRRSMWEFLSDINARGTTIILTTHYLEEAEQLCRGIAILDKGRIIEHTTVKHLLTTVNYETYILDLKHDVSEVSSLPGVSLIQTDSTTLEATLPKGRSLNTLFEHLNQHQIEVLSMRNKVNRLEELFIDRVGQADKTKVKAL